MALIGTIRKNGWILIATMVLALGGFILMDIISNSQRYQSGDANTIGKVDGKDIQYSEFENYRSLVYANSPAEQSNSIRQQIWEYFVQRTVVEKLAKEAGLGVGKDELRNLQFSTNPQEISPLITARFNNAQGQQQLMAVKNAIESGTIDFANPEQRQFWEYWAVQEKEIIKERNQDKLLNMVVKGLYAPNWLAEAAFKEGNERLDFVYVRVPLAKVTDNEAVPTDDDFNAFLKENPKLYNQEEETRNIDYAIFDVLPTSQDTAAALNAVNNLKDGLANATNDSTFVIANNGQFDGLFRKKAELPPSISDALMQGTVGSVVGPYRDGDMWIMGKIVARKAVPDSVRARHILIREPGAEARVDSLIGLLKAGTARFDTLAARFGTDATAQRGGDLGFFAQGQMVPEFNNLCFDRGEQGQTYKVRTQFGVHVVEITGKKFLTNESSVKAAYISQRIEPGKLTQQTIKDKALALAQQTKTSADLRSKETLVKEAVGLKANDFAINGIAATGDDIREIMRWVFNPETKVDAVNKQVFVLRDPAGGYFDSKYVVAVLKGIIPAGKASVASLKANPVVVAEVTNRKKAEVLKGKIGSVSDLNAMASQWGVPVDTMMSATVQQSVIKSSGLEPRVIATAFATAKDAISTPVAGKNGVYVVQPIRDKVTPKGEGDMRIFRRQVVSACGSNVQFNFANSLKKGVNIKDNRSRFF
jgi:peptidyl-prolyl cis-trans isomerase D